MRSFLILLLISLAAVSTSAAGSPLLNRAADKWLAEGNRWAFTMQVRKLDGNGAAKEVRVEHYDPSKPASGRWELMTVNGQPPTEERRAAWQKAKLRKLRGAPKSLAQFLDFENAVAKSATPTTVSYHLPMRSDHNWILPLEQVALTVTINKTTYAVERVEAGLNEPFRVALGLASILDVDFDLQMHPAEGEGTDNGPASAHPTGVAHMVVGRLGERIEYSWSDFRRVASAPDAKTE